MINEPIKKTLNYPLVWSKLKAEQEPPDTPLHTPQMAETQTSQSQPTSSSAPLSDKCDVLKVTYKIEHEVKQSELEKHEWINITVITMWSNGTWTEHNAAEMKGFQTFDTGRWLKHQRFRVIINGVVYESCNDCMEMYPIPINYDTDSVAHNAAKDAHRCGYLHSARRGAIHFGEFVVTMYAHYTAADDDISASTSSSPPTTQTDQPTTPPDL